MDNKKSPTKKTRAWIVSEKTAVSLVRKIQETFEHKVTVSLFSDGRAAVYPTWPGGRSAFDKFMRQAGNFTEARITLNEI